MLYLKNCTIKKIITILLLIILLFNVAGYRIALNFLQKNAVQKLDYTINNNHYADTDLIEITTPLNMPYIADKDFEATVGETTINGIHYQYVKRKIVNNVLHLYCLPNNEKTNLAASKTAIEKNNIEGDRNNSDKKNSNSIIKILSADYIGVAVNYTSNTLQIILPLKTYINNSFYYTQYKPSAAGKPPQQLV